MPSSLSRYLVSNTDTIQRFFIFSYYLLAWAFFLCPVYPLYLIIFYLYVGVPGLLLLWLKKPHWLTHPLMIAIYAYLIYCDATLIFNIHDNLAGCADLLKKTAITLGFIWVSVLFFTTIPSIERYIDNACYWVIIATPLSIATHFLLYKNTLFDRLEPIAQAHHPIIGACVYGIVGLCALHQLLTRHFDRRSWLYIAAIVCVLTVVFLTGSKGPMLAIAASYTLLTFLLLSVRWRIIFIATLIAAIAGAGFYIFHVYAHTPHHTGYIATLMNRGLSERPQIWAYAWSQIPIAPWFGHGMAAHFEVETSPHIFVFHPHSLYLATLYYTGLAGLALMLNMIAMVGWGVARSHDKLWQYLAATLLLYLFLSTLSDIARLIASPKDLLFMFWLPLCILVAHLIKEEQSAT